MKAKYIVNNYRISEFNYGDIIALKNHSGYKRVMVCQDICYYTRERCTTFLDLGRGITEYPDKFHNYEIGFPNSSSRQSLTNKYDYYMKVISNKDRTIRKRLKDFNKKKRSIDKIGHKSIIKTKTGIYMLLKYEDRSFYMLLNIKDYSLYRDHKANSVQDVYKNYTGRDLSDDIIGYLEYTEYDMYKLDSLGRYVLCNELIADTGVCFACL